MTLWPLAGPSPPTRLALVARLPRERCLDGAVRLDGLPGVEALLLLAEPLGGLRVRVVLLNEARQAALDLDSLMGVVEGTTRAGGPLLGVERRTQDGRDSAVLTDVEVEPGLDLVTILAQLRRLGLDGQDEREEGLGHRVAQDRLLGERRQGLALGLQGGLALLGGLGSRHLLCERLDLGRDDLGSDAERLREEVGRSRPLLDGVVHV